jgi:hypothetical protein
MAAYNKFNLFMEAAMEKKHNLATDQLVAALSNVAPVATNSVLADITQIAYTNLSSRNITTSSSSSSGSTYSYVPTDLVLTASGAVATFRYIIIYNDTATNDDLICWFDYGSAVTMASGDTFTLDFGTSLFTAG